MAKNSTFTENLNYLEETVTLSSVDIPSCRISDVLLSLPPINKTPSFCGQIREVYLGANKEKDGPHCPVVTTK